MTHSIDTKNSIKESEIELATNVLPLKLNEKTQSIKEIH